METKLNISHDDIYADVRAWLLKLFPAWEVVRSYSNNVPLPNVPFILLHILHERDLSTRTHNYDVDAGTAQVGSTVHLEMQIDCYGEESGTAARTIAQLWQDFQAAEHLQVCQPLYCEQPRHIPMTNEVSDFEMRWSLTVALNYNPSITHAQDFVKHIRIHTQHLNP